MQGAQRSDRTWQHAQGERQGRVDEHFLHTTYTVCYKAAAVEYCSLSDDTCYSV
jgi:hypothetical protein